MPHADEGRLHAYLDGALQAEDPAAARVLERHLASCDDCRGLLESARAVRDRAARLLADAVPGPALDAPPWTEVLHRAGRAGGSAAASSIDRDGAASKAGVTDGNAGPPVRPRLPRLERLAWAASLFVALGVGFWAHAALGVGPFDRVDAPRDDASAALQMAPSRPPAEPAQVTAEGAPLRDDVAAETGEGVSGRPDAPPAASPPGGRAPARAAAADEPPSAGRTGEETILGRPLLNGLRATIPGADASARADAGGTTDPADAREADGSRRERAADPAPSADALTRDGARVQGKAGADAREASADEAPAAPAAPPSVALEALELEDAPEAEARDSGSWTRVEPDEARALLGRAPLAVPDAELLELSWGGGGETVRVTQRLSTGEVLDLYEWAARRDGSAGFERAEAEGDSAALRKEPDWASGGGRWTMVAFDGLLVAASGPVDPAVLRRVLERLEPLPMR